MSNDQTDRLEEFSKSGVLPQRVSLTGAEVEPLSEVLICDSFAGGRRYERDMPESLSLVRKFSNGREVRREYVQRVERDLLRAFSKFFVGHDADSINKKIDQLKESDGEGWVAGEILRLVYAHTTDRYIPGDRCGT